MSFDDPIKVLRSVYSHVEDTSHTINLADDSKRRWVGFSCAGCLDEYITWGCPVITMPDYQLRERYNAEEVILVNFMRNQEGRIVIREALNRYAFHKITTQQLQGQLDEKSGAGPTTENEIKLLENMFMEESDKQVVSNEEAIIEILSRSFRNNIPSRYERTPVI
jgi:hypothetical protein